MKALKIIGFILLLALIGLVAYWKFFAYQAELKKVGELELQLQKTEQLQLLVNTDSLKNTYNTINENTKFLQQHTGVTSKEVALTIAHYQSIKKPLGVILKNSSKMSAELNTITQKINDLNTDIKSRSISEKEANLNLQTEFENLKNIENQIDKTQKHLPELKNIFDTYDPKIEKLIINLIEQH